MSNIECLYCGKSFSNDRSPEALYCNARCYFNANMSEETRQRREKKKIAVRRAANSRRRVRKLNNGGSHTADELLQLIDDSNGLCAYCGEPYTEYEIDHIKPVSKGGSDNIDNLCVSCPRCNRSKSNLDLEIFLKNNRRNFVPFNRS